MKRSLVGTVAVVTALVVLAGTVMAAADIRVIVNGNLVSMPVVPQIVNDRVMVPVRAIAEALNAKVEWNPDQRVVSITEANSSSMTQRIYQLERALQSTTADQAIKTYAEGVKTRNGAQQYAMLSPELRQSKLSDFEGFYWVTGVSSPWVDNYEITKVKDNTSGAVEYELKLNWMTSTGPAGSSVEKITVSPYHFTTGGFAPGAGEPQETRYFISVIQ